MEKPRIVIIDDDFSYIIPLQSKFVYEFLDDVEIEIITSEDYVETFFQKIQKIDVLIINKKFYTASLVNHEINHIFIMTEEQDDQTTYPNGEHLIFKYTNAKGIFLEIVGISDLKIPRKNDKQKPQIVLVTSASGGVGKTTIALGIAAALSDMYKRVLYIEASQLQSFQYFMQDDSPIVNQYIYEKLMQPDKGLYQSIKGQFRNEKFDYVPPFKAALMAFGIEYRIFGQIAKAAKESGDYDYIIIDADSTFDEMKANMIRMADYVLMITEPSSQSIYKTNLFVSNISNNRSGKYLFICNKYNVENQKTLNVADTMKYKTDEYIEEIDKYADMKCGQFGMQEGIRKVAFLLM